MKNKTWYDYENECLDIDKWLEEKLDIDKWIRKLDEKAQRSNKCKENQE